MQFKIFKFTVLNNLIYVLPHPVNIQCMYVGMYICMCAHACTHVCVYAKCVHKDIKTFS